MPSAEVGRLAAMMADGRAAEAPRSIPILLGEGCARAAGVPPIEAIGREVFRHLSRSNESEVRNMCPDWPETSDKHVASAFTKWLRQLSPLQRVTTVAPFYQVPVPLFYRDLADLVVSGLVTSVLTTSIDNLFEQALDDAGLRRWRDYVVTVVGADSRVPEPDEVPSVQLFKLQGDLGENYVPVDSEEIETALHTARRLFRPELSSDLIIVGHELRGQSQPIDEWLTRGSGGTVWWVAPEVERALMHPVEDSRHVRYIDGEVGDPEVFFGLLATHLIRLPALRSVTAPSAQPESLRSEDPGQADAELLRAEYYRGRLLKTRSVTQKIQEQRVPGVPNPARETELVYQRRLERRLSHLVAVSGVVAETVAGSGIIPSYVPVAAVRAAVMAAVRAVEAHPELPRALIDFVASQAAAVEEQAETTEPDSTVLASAAEAVYTVTKGLENVVDASTVEELALAVHDVEEEIGR